MSTLSEFQYAFGTTSEDQIPVRKGTGFVDSPIEAGGGRDARSIGFLQVTARNDTTLEVSESGGFTPLASLATLTVNNQYELSSVFGVIGIYTLTSHAVVAGADNDTAVFTYVSGALPIIVGNLGLTRVYEIGSSLVIDELKAPTGELRGIAITDTGRLINTEIVSQPTDATPVPVEPAQIVEVTNVNVTEQYVYNTTEVVQMIDNSVIFDDTAVWSAINVNAAQLGEAVGTNPSDGFIPYRFNENTFNDSSISYVAEVPESTGERAGTGDALGTYTNQSATNSATLFNIPVSAIAGDVFTLVSTHFTTAGDFFELSDGGSNTGIYELTRAYVATPVVVAPQFTHVSGAIPTDFANGATITFRDTEIPTIPAVPAITTIADDITATGLGDAIPQDSNGVVGIAADGTLSQLSGQLIPTTGTGTTEIETTTVVEATLDLEAIRVGGDGESVRTQIIYRSTGTDLTGLYNENDIVRFNGAFPGDTSFQLIDINGANAVGTGYDDASSVFGASNRAGLDFLFGFRISPLEDIGTDAEYTDGTLPTGYLDSYSNKETGFTVPTFTSNPHRISDTEWLICLNFTNPPFGSYSPGSFDFHIEGSDGNGATDVLPANYNAADTRRMEYYYASIVAPGSGWTTTLRTTQERTDVTIEEYADGFLEIAGINFEGTILPLTTGEFGAAGQRVVVNPTENGLLFEDVPPAGAAIGTVATNNIPLWDGDSFEDSPIDTVAGSAGSSVSVGTFSEIQDIQTGSIASSIVTTLSGTDGIAYISFNVDDPAGFTNGDTYESLEFDYSGTVQGQGTSTWTGPWIYLQAADGANNLAESLIYKVLPGAPASFSSDDGNINWVTDHALPFVYSTGFSSIDFSNASTPAETTITDNLTVTGSIAGEERDVTSSTTISEPPAATKAAGSTTFLNYGNFASTGYDQGIVDSTLLNGILAAGGTVTFTITGEPQVYTVTAVPISGVTFQFSIGAFTPGLVNTVNTANEINITYEETETVQATTVIGDLTVTGETDLSLQNENPSANVSQFRVWAGTQAQFDTQFDNDGSGSTSGTPAETDGSVIYIIT